MIKPGFLLFVLLLLFVSHKTCFSIGGDILLSGQSLSGRQTLIFENDIFELGWQEREKKNTTDDAKTWRIYFFSFLLYFGFFEIFSKIKSKIGSNSYESFTGI